MSPSGRSSRTFWNQTLYLCSPIRVLFPPVRMVMVPPRHYCVVSNPVARDDDNQVLFDTSGQAKLRHADLEIRLAQDPFPLYPGEEIQQVCRGRCSGLDVGDVL